MANWAGEIDVFIHVLDVETTRGFEVPRCQMSLRFG